MRIFTYERLKEELKIGKSMMSAFRAGNHRSLATILDANVTTLAAGVLFVYGNSSVKGFATSLIVSILVGFITNVFGTRFLLGLLVKSRYFDKTRIFWCETKGYYSINKRCSTSANEI